MSTPWRATAINMGIVAGVSVPLFVVLPWLWGFMLGADDRWSMLTRFPGDVLFLYLVMGWPLLLGGVLHQLLLLALPATAPSWSRRLSGVLVPLVLIGRWILYGSVGALMSPEIGLPLLAGTAAYLIAMRLP